MSTINHYFPESWTRRIAQILPNGDTAAPALSFLGDNPTTTGTLAAIIVSNGVFNRYTTGAVTGNDAGIQGRDLYRRDLEAAMFIRFKLNQTSNSRIFIGFSNQLFGVMMASDNPVGHYFGLQYSSGRGDTSFKFIRKDGTTQTLANIAAVDTDYHDLYLSMFPTAGSNAVLLGFDNVTPLEATTLLPGNANNYRLVAGIETQADAAKSIEVGTCIIHQVY